MTPDERFDAKTQPEPTTGCTLWLGATDANGYGHFWDGKRSVYAHVFSFERARGPVPPGLVLDHLRCDTPGCVNEWHVEPSTRAANIARAIPPRPSSCPAGHVMPSTGRRRCPECHATRERNRHRARKGVPAYVEKPGS